MFRDDPTYAQEQRIPVLKWPLRLHQDDKRFLAVPGDGERHTMVAPHVRTIPLDRPLDVLRVMIDPRDNDEVLETAGDVEFAALDESQVAGAEKRPRRPVVEQARLEGRGAVLGLSPIARRDAGVRNPDLTDLVR